MTLVTFRNLAGCVLFAAIAGPASAATFTYDGEVIFTEPTIGGAVLAPLGTPGTVVLNIDDSNPSLPVDDPIDFPEEFMASVNVPGFITGSMMSDESFLGTFEATATTLHVSGYGPTTIADPGSAVFLSEAFHVFRVSYGTPLASAPTTIGEVVAALAAPGAIGFFSHELEADAGGFIRTRVGFTDPPSEVPLPATVWLMLAALGGLGWTKRKV